MRHANNAVIVGFALLGLSAWCLWRCEAAPTAGQGETMYHGTTPELQVTFSYPEQWPLHEEQGTMESYRAVRIMAPRNAEGTYTSHFSVRGALLTSQSGAAASVQERIAHYKQHLVADARVLAEATREVGGLQAMELVVAYTQPAIHRKGIKAVAVPLKEHKIVMASPSHVYEISYTADQREYDRYATVFDRLVDSFRLE